MLQTICTYVQYLCIFWVEILLETGFTGLHITSKSKCSKFSVQHSGKHVASRRDADCSHIIGEREREKQISHRPPYQIKSTAAAAAILLHNTTNEAHNGACWGDLQGVQFKSGNKRSLMAH